MYRGFSTLIENFICPLLKLLDFQLIELHFLQGYQIHPLSNYLL